MKVRDFQEKLTPAARQALDELTEEHRREILLRAAQSAATSTGEVREISVHDILVSVIKPRTEFASMPTLGSMPTLVERLLNVYLLSGVSVGALSLLYFVLRTSASLLRFEELLWLLLGLTGFAVAALSFLLQRLMLLRRIRWRFSDRIAYDPMGPSAAFIAAWQKLELTLRQAAASDFGESTAQQPISLLVDRLVQKGVLRAGDAERCRKLLRMRNRIVHEGLAGPQEGLLSAFSEVQSILSNLGDVT